MNCKNQKSKMQKIANFLSLNDFCPKFTVIAVELELSCAPAQLNSTQGEYYTTVYDTRAEVHGISDGVHETIS